MNTEAINDLAQKFLNGTATAEEKAMLHDWYALKLAGDEEVVAIANEEDREEIKRRLYASVMGRLQLEIIGRSAGLKANGIHERIGQLSPDLADRPGTESKRMRLRPKALLRYGVGMAAAVAVIVFGVWFFSASRHSDTGQDPGSAAYANDIKPGANRATLTLADGRTIALSEAKSGVVIGDSSLKYVDHTLVIPTERSIPTGRSEERSLNPTGGKDLSVLRDGDSVKAKVGPWGAGKAEMLTARTPRGGTYQVVLPDRTKVWLNADSKLSFPSRFGDKERVVFLQGEAYFEVAASYRSLRGRPGAGRGNLRERVPFIVESPGQRVEVLGTHFNINSYEDEGSVRTTLLEGSVAVSYAEGKSRAGVLKQVQDDVGEKQHVDDGLYKENGARNVVDPVRSERVVLIPGQQAIAGVSGRINVRQVDPEDVIDWKNGDFVFRGESLEKVMRKISRWYDVEVTYASDDLKRITVGGFVSRSRSISAVLQLMERTGKLKFKIEGGRVIVSR